MPMAKSLIGTYRDASYKWMRCSLPSAKRRPPRINSWTFFHRSAGSRLTITGSGYKRPHLADSWSFLGPAGIDPLFGQRATLVSGGGSSPCRRRGRQCDRERIAARHHEGNQPSDGTLAGRVRANYCSSAIYGSARPLSRPAALWRPERRVRLSGLPGVAAVSPHSPRSAALASFCPSLAGEASVGPPRFGASPLRFGSL